jgi:hypothetical protein
MRINTNLKIHQPSLLLSLSLAAALSGCGDSPSDQPKPGSTDFTNDEIANNGRGELNSPSAGAVDDGAADPKAPPSGRMGEVQEADIYRIDGDRMFLFNTYRGFVAYDIKNTKNPERLSRLPVYGYPVEMFVQGNTVYALLSDALYLTGEKSDMKFERHNVSQMVAIDVSDIKNPRILQTVDIIGNLREGVSRKIENTIYVVSDVAQNYWWGWNYPGQSRAEQKEQAWVYSFNVANPSSMQLVKKLQIFEGGGVQFNDPKLGIGLYRSFQSVAISATANALMVVENWYLSTYNNGVTSNGSYRCGSYSSDQQARVSIIDISDPAGDIRVHTKFETEGALGDQFKMTYVDDPKAKTGTFFGIFARQGWSGSNCSGQSHIENVIESWDVTNGSAPVKLSGLAFGKQDETVRGSAFDVERNVAYAITARQIDPLYTIDLSDRNSLRILDSIDGLSGDMSVFRLVAGKGFLMGIGRDQSATCMGFQDTETWRSSNIAVSLIDVRNLKDIKLVQRQCVAIENAEWIGSDVTWNMDQAHKMIGMHSDGKTNVLTLPVYYAKKSQENNWWWYHYETAVGVMTWNLDDYAAGVTGAEKNVLQNYGTVIHPEGQVRRSIVFSHASSGRRMMINLSDTHLSMVDMTDLLKPKLDSIVELAPHYSQIFAFGAYVVEHIQDSPDYGWNGQGVSEFRVKPATGGDVEATAAIATFRIGQVNQVLKHENSLLLFRFVQGEKIGATGQYVPPTQEVVVMDMTDPAKPKLAGSTPMPSNVYPYYQYWCGGYGGYWFDNQNNWVSTTSGIVMLSQDWEQATQKPRWLLNFLDLRTPGAPKMQQTLITGPGYDEFVGLVRDDVDRSGFYLAYRDNIGVLTKAGQGFTSYKYYAQRFGVTAAGFVGGETVNLPGRLVRTWSGAGVNRLFLTQDHFNKQVATPDGKEMYWRNDFQLNLLQASRAGGRPVASLLDSFRFEDQYLSDLIPMGDKLFVNVGRTGNYWGYGRGGLDDGIAVGGIAPGVAAFGQTVDAPADAWQDYSDHVMVFDLSKGKLSRTFDRATATVGVRFMGINRNHLFLNLPGDGILALDISNPDAPSGRQFLRTLGYASYIEFAGNTAYIASGNFGIQTMTLVGPKVLSIR